jgi:uncharacterized protein (DUF1697 family)
MRPPDAVRGGRLSDHRHVALLRGINVGRAKRVSMADLKAAVEGLGYTAVRTLLNSGNVVFSRPGMVRGDPAARIEAAVLERTGVGSRVTVLTAAELDAILRGNPLTKRGDDPSRLFVTVLAEPAGRKPLVPLTRDDWGADALALGPRVAYLWCPSGMMQSPLAERVARLLGDGATTRNWATMLKIQAAL